MPAPPVEKGSRGAEWLGYTGACAHRSKAAGRHLQGWEEQEAARGCRLGARGTGRIVGGNGLGVRSEGHQDGCGGCGEQAVPWSCRMGGRGISRDGDIAGWE